MNCIRTAQPSKLATVRVESNSGGRVSAIEVVGAVILHNGLVLCTQRGPEGDLAGLWEFPGGKVEQDESPPDALRREIREELGCRVSVGESVIATRHVYPFATVVLTTYWCRLTAGQPALTVHSDLAWLRPEELPQLPWAPADIPAVEMIASAATPGTR